MDWKRIFRILVCLVLVCCLLVQVSPIQAKALLPESIAVSAGIVIASVLVGLGFTSGVNAQADVIDNMVSDCKEYFENNNYEILGGVVPVYSVERGGEGSFYYVAKEFVEHVRDWFFENFAVDTETGEVFDKLDVEIPEGYASYNGVVLPELPVPDDSSCVYAVISRSSGSYYYLRMFSVPLCCKSSTSSEFSLYPTDSGKTFQYRTTVSSSAWALQSSGTCAPNGGYSFSRDGFFWTNHDIFDQETGSLFLGGTSPITSEGECLYTSTGYIAASSVPLDEAYADWSAGVISIPGETDDQPYITGYPVGLAPSLEETLGLTQSDVWQGVSTYGQTGGDISNPDDDDHNDTGGLTLGDVTVTTFIAKLLADLTRSLFGQTGPQTLTELFGSHFKELQSTLSNMQSSLSQILSDIGTYIQSLPEYFSDLFAQTWAELQTHFSNLTQTLTDILTKIQTEFQSLTQTLTDALTNLKTDLLQGVKDLFLPQEGYIDQKIDGLTSKYEFANQIATTGKNLEFWLLNLGQQPPIIYIDLGATRGSYNIGQKTVLMDLTWYEEYKPTMDTIMSAFLWLWFIWRMMLSLPGIIQGTSGFWTKTDSSAGAGTWERPAGRLNSGDDIKQLGTSNYHSPGSGGRHYIKHD